MGNSSSHSKHSSRRHQRDDRGGGSSYYGRRPSSSTSSGAPGGAPSAPGKPYLVVASPADEPDVITVKWKSPSNDGGSRITGYVVEHRRTISPHWVRATPGTVQQNHLTLSGLEPGWRYQFRVKAANASGHSPPSIVSDPVSITVHRTAVVAPVFVRGIEDRVALENEQVKFEVEFEGTPTPKISWYKDGFELFSNRRQRVNTDNGVSTLYIHQAEYSDEGEIKCSATNKAGHAITKARLRLEAPPMVRLPQDYEEGLLLEQNEPMRLKVSVSGRPLPQVTWLHDGEEIRGGDRFEVMHTDKYAALKLASIKRSDRGCYQIQAVNPLGEHTASFLVTVTDRPSPPGKVHVSKTSGKSVTLSWKPPEDDGGCKIGNYIIEYNRVGWDMWLKASTSRLLTADLDDLLEGSEYRFRVKAENPYGISVPSEMSDLIFFPDIKRGIYKPVITTSLLSEDEEGLVKVQETGMFEYFGRKSKSPEPPLKSRKLSVDEVSPPVPKRRKKKPKADLNSSESDIYKSLSSFDVSETRQQPIEQKDHWGLPPRLKANNANLKDLPNSQKATSLDYKTQGNSTDSLLLLNFERGPAPPISLSSPELGVESEAFEEHIRNSYSSSELLYERNLSRFNGYSNDDKLSSEAQKIAIYAMDRKDSLRRSPITRISNEGSEDKSILSDSDSIQSVVEISKKTSSYVSLAKSIEEKMEDEFKETINDDSDIMVPSTSFSGLELQTSKAHSDGEEYVSDNSSDEEFMKFGSGKRALEHNTSSAFFSTVYYDDDYLSDQKLSDRERSISPAANVAPEKSDAISQDSLNNSDSVSSDGDYSRSDKDNNDSRSDKDNDNSQSDKDNDGDDAEKSSESPSNSGQTVENQRAHNPDEICTVESDDIYRPRDGIPKYVMLPNPFYRNHTAATADGSSGPGGTVPPEIPKREENNGGGHMSIPVITVTEMTEERYGPNTPILKQIFVPTFAGQNESYYDKYNNVNSSTFNTLSKRSPERDADREPVDDGGDRGHGDFDPQSPPETPSPPDAQENAEMIAVKHYGDIVERYSGVAKKTASKTYLDFEQLKMAAAVEHDQPVVDAAADGYYESGTEDGDYDDRDGDGDEYGDGNSAADEPETGSQNDDSATPDHRQLATGPAVTEPNAIPYLKIFGNLSLALLGFWLYAFKDERLSVPIFGFLSFRFFKTQIWDRI